MCLPESGEQPSQYEEKYKNRTEIRFVQQSSQGGLIYYMQYLLVIYYYSSSLHRKAAKSISHDFGEVPWRERIVQ